jgi:hypothetical protein
MKIKNSQSAFTHKRNPDQEQNLRIPILLEAILGIVIFVVLMGRTFLEGFFKAKTASEKHKSAGPYQGNP